MHANRLDQGQRLADPNGFPFAIMQFVLQTGAPLSTLEWFRSRHPDGHELPDPRAFRDILRLVKDDIREVLYTECQNALYINLALDGWTDPRGRRYQGVTARLINRDARKLSSSTRVLMMKEIKTVHESAKQLRAIIDRCMYQYDIHSTVLNICTDRGSMNRSAFRNPNKLLINIFEDPDWLWLPCSCHLLNNILSKFLSEIADDLLKPIFRIQHRFRKSGPFLSYLLQTDSIRTTIPSVSEVRWYSCEELLVSLNYLWPYMLGFIEREHLRMPELTDEVRHNITLLNVLAAEFRRAQKLLESDGFAAGSQFIPSYLAIRARIREFAEIAPDAVNATLAFMDGLEREFSTEWDVFTLMTFLNPSIQWIPGRSCSDERFGRIAQALIEWIDQELSFEHEPTPSEPSRFDFMSWFPSRPTLQLSAQHQCEAYLQRRTTGLPPLWPEFWGSEFAQTNCRQLSRVAERVLSFLATSASAERTFSVGRSIAGDYQMAMKPETLSARVMIQANWSIAIVSLQKILSLGRAGWTELLKARQARANEVDNLWQLELLDCTLSHRA
jgi:hypothetical protein